MNNFKSYAILLGLTLALGACNSKGGGAGGEGNPKSLSSQLDASRFHSSSKKMIGVGGTQAASANVSEDDDEVKDDDKVADNGRNPLNVDLEKNYKRMNPDEYEPIFTQLVNESKPSANYNMGARYLTRSLVTFDDICNVIEEVEHTVLLGKVNDFRNLEQRTVDKTASDPCFAEYVNEETTVVGLYNEHALAGIKLPDDFEVMRESQVYQVNPRVFIVHGEEADIIISFKEDGKIHFDGLFYYNGNMAAVISQIPIESVGREELMQLHGERFPTVRQVPCEEAGSVLCTVESDNDWTVIDMDEYYKANVQNIIED